MLREEKTPPVLTRSGLSGINLCSTDMFPYNQHDSDECVAAALCMGLYIKIVLSSSSKLELIKTTNDMPSPAYVYHVSRVSECLASDGKTCGCGINCGGVCDKKCGCLLQIGAQVLMEKGTPPVSCWPTEKGNIKDQDMVNFYNKDPTLGAKFWYFLDEVDYFEPTLLVALNHLRRKNPIVINLKIFPITSAFLTSSKYSDTLPVMPTPAPGKEPDDAYGHCVVITGFDEKTKMLLCLNSFGKDWGLNGFFGIPFVTFSPAYIYRAVGLVRGHIAFDDE